MEIKRIMNLELEDKHIIVAGGLGGIGSKTVNLLLEEGALVTVLTQSSEKYLNSKLNHENLNIKKTDYKNKKCLFEEINKANKKSPLSGFISLIGTGRSKLDPFLSEEESKRMWDINYFFPRNISEQFVKVIKSPNNNSSTSSYFITFFSSIAASCYLGAPTEYSVSKSALERLTKELSWKLSPVFRVNCISPGNVYFEGGTWDKIKKSGEINVDKLINEKVPSRRLGNPNDIAAFAVFLSSSKYASFFNGSCVIIDGGQKNCI